MTDLLSCPFCGCAAKAHIWENHTGGNGDEGDCQGQGCTDPDNPGHN